MKLQARRLDLDGALIGVAIALALASGLALTRPVVLHPVGWAPPTPFAGALELEVGEIRRRPAGSLIWYSAEPGDTLYLGDALFVAEGGVGTVRLEDGALLELEEKTLVVLEPTGRDLPAAIALQRGSLTVSGGSVPRALSTEKTQASLAPGSEAVLTRADQHDALEVRRGEVTLENGARVASSRWQARLQSPLPGQSVLAGRPLSFRYEGAPAGASLQLARDRGFAEVEEPSDALPPGTYWWRLVDAARAPVSELRRFTVLADVAPTPLSPTDDARFAAAEVPLRWRAVPGARQYVVEVAAGPDFATALFRTEVSAARAVWTSAEDGTFYWRARAKLAGDEGQWSHPARFRVALRPLPAAPVLSAPELEVPPARTPQP